MTLPMAQPPTQPVQARFAHENGTQLRLQCFVTIRDAEQRVLAARIQGYDGWCIPGETLLLNESPDNAARRVVATWFETPMQLWLDRVMSFPATGPEDDRWYLIFIYNAEAPAGLKGTPDTLELKFFPVNAPPPQFAMSHADVWAQLQ